MEQLRAEGGATAPGIQPGWHPTTQFFFLKSIGNA